MKKNYWKPSKAKLTFAGLLIGFLGLFLLSSCEEDELGVGSSIFGSIAEVNQTAFVDLVAHAYSVNFSDTIRTDRTYLPFASIGAYDEPDFNLTKASFYTQVRLSELNPDFGANPSVSSVELFIPVLSENDPTITGATDNIEDGSIYGDNSLGMTLRVSAIEDPSFLLENTDRLNNNQSFSTGPLLGTLAITSSNITAREILIDGEPTGVFEIGYTVSLDTNYFFDNLVQFPSTSDVLSDQSSFITLAMNGLKIDVIENDGFIFNTVPRNMMLTVNYTNDEISPEENSYSLSISDSNNVYFAEYQNAGATAIASSNGTTGDERIYLQGLGGSRASIRLNDAEIADIKDSVQNSGWVINNAKLKFFVDTAINEELPENLFLYVEEPANNSFSLLDDYFDENPTDGTLDIFAAGSIVPNFDSEENFYTVNLTEHFKNIVEQDTDADGAIKENRDLVLSVGNLAGTDGSSGFSFITDPYLQDRSYNPSRVVIFGNNTSDLSKRLRLEVSYTKI